MAFVGRSPLSDEYRETRACLPRPARVSLLKRQLREADGLGSPLTRAVPMGLSLARFRTRILAISDEVQLLRLLRSSLAPEGCKIVAAAKSAAMAPPVDPPEIVILDLDQFDDQLFSQARRVFAGAEVIALGNAYSEAECVVVLEMGIDYLARPFRPKELLARVRAAEIRHLAANGFQRQYRVGPLVVDLIDCTAMLDGRPLSLSRSELRILAALARHAGGVATFRDILAVLGRPDSRRNRQALRAFIHSLRGKFALDPLGPALIFNEARVGYRLAAEPGDPAGLGGDDQGTEGDGCVSSSPSRFVAE